MIPTTERAAVAPADAARPTTVRLDLRAAAQAHRPAIEASPSTRAAAVGTWRGRMINEHGSAIVFEGLAAQIRATELGEAAAARCIGFAAEERHHGVLCGAVVEALGAHAVADVPPPEACPVHTDTTPLAGALRNILSVCCLSETVAVALIGAEREEMPEGPLRDLLTEIWADECGHAHFGWRLLRDLLADRPNLRADLTTYLPVALAHLEVHELAHLPDGPPPPPEAAALGLCDGVHARALFAATVEQVILPNLEAMGLPARAAWSNRHTAAHHLAAHTQARVAQVRTAALATHP